MTPEQLAGNLQDGAGTKAISKITEAVSALAVAFDTLSQAGEWDASGEVVHIMVKLCDVQAMITRQTWPATEPAPTVEETSAAIDGDPWRPGA